MNDLTVSNVERQNVLNNRYAVDALQENLGFTGMLFEGEYRFTKKMVADFYEVDLSTINRYISQNEEELKYNGYFLYRGKLLKELKLQFGHVMNEMTKTTQLGLFSFRAVLNMGMLLTESEKAKQVRARILDIVISTINKRAGGGTKYINTRDIDFLPAAIEEDNYRKNFTTAVGGGIRKVLDFVQNDLYYPTFVDKLTYLVFGLCTGHYFEDSNKRVALTIGVWFLVHNGYYWHAYGFMQCMEAIIYHVAAGRIDKDLLQRIITCYMANEDYPESLKLEIIHAIDNQPTGIDE